MDDIFGVALGIGRRKAASDIACAGDEPGTDRACFGGEPECIDRRFGGRHFSIGHTGDQKVLPHREPDIAVAMLMRNPGKATHLGSRDPRNRQDDADPVETLLLLGVHADVSTAIKGGPRQDRIRGYLCQFATKHLLDTNDVFFDAPCVEHIFEPRLVAVGTISVFDIDADDRIGDLRRFFRSDDHSGVAGEILVARDAAQREAKPHARLRSETGLHLDGLKSDVVGILKHRYATGPVKSDIEFARQTVQRAFIENMEVPFARVGARID